MQPAAPSKNVRQTILSIVLSRKPISIESILKDDSIVVNDNEDLNIYRNQIRMFIGYMNKYKGDYYAVRSIMGISEKTVFRYLSDNLIVYDMRANRHIALSQDQVQQIELSDMRFLNCTPTVKRILLARISNSTNKSLDV